MDKLNSKLVQIGENTFFLKTTEKDQSGIANLTEIDILCRLGNEYSLRAEAIHCTDDKVSLLIPTSCFFLENIVEHLPTSKKIRFVAQIAEMLDHYHSSEISRIDLDINNIGVEEDRIVFLDLSRALYSDEFVSDDVQNFGKLCFRIFCRTGFNDYSKNTDIEEGTRYIDPRYIDLVREFLTTVLTEECYFSDIINHELLFSYCTEITEPLHETVLPVYSEDHRDIIKLVYSWSKECFPEERAEVLFLAIDIFNRISTSTRTAPLDRMTAGGAALFIAAKLLVRNFRIDSLLKTINSTVPKITVLLLIGEEQRIVNELAGILNVDRVYRMCPDFYYVKAAFFNVLMSRDSRLYLQISEEEIDNLIRDESLEGSKISRSKACIKDL